MFNKGPLIKHVFSILKFTAVAVFIFFFTANITYSLMGEDRPTVEITINEEGHIIQTGSLLGDELWYPSKKATGIIRINNNFKNMSIKSLGLEVVISKSKTNIDRNLVFNSFINNMRLSIIKGRLLVFEDIILDKVCFTEILFRTDEPIYDGIKLDGENQFNIYKNDSMDLKYTIYMDENSGQELENLEAQVNLLLNVGGSNIE